MIKVILLWVLMTVPVWAVDQHITAIVNDRPSGTLVEYQPFAHTYEDTWETTQRKLRPASTGGTISNLHVEFNVAPGAGNSYAFIFMQNGSASIFGCTIADTALFCDSSTTLSISQGDTLLLRSTPSSSPDDPVLMKWTHDFTPGTADNYTYYGSSTPTGIGTDSGPGGSTIMGNTPAAAGTDGQEHLIGFSGTLKNLHVYNHFGPGTGKTRTFTLELNDSLTSLTCSTTGNGQDSCSDTVNTVSVVEGDQVVIHWVGDPVGGGFTSDLYGTGITFVSDTVDLYPIMGNAKNIGQTASTFYPSEGARLFENTTEADVQLLLNSTNISKLDVRGLILSNTPDGDFTFTLRVNGSDTTLSCAICLSACSGTTADCESINDIVIAEDDDLSMKVVSENTNINSNVIALYSLSVGELSARRFYRTY